MKVMIATIVSAALAAGCAGSSGSGNDPIAQQNSPVEAVGSPVPAATQPPTDVIPEPGAQLSERLVGMWKNGSCGEREYVREITFERGGTFTASDRVAPCPKDANCVWSGIIPWKGRWTLEDRTIAIRMEPIEHRVQPTQLPQSFVVLGEAPLSIGERHDKLVCPFQRAK